MQEVDDLFPRVDRAVLKRLLENRSLNMNSFLTQLRNASCGGRTFKTARKPEIRIKHKGLDFEEDDVGQYFDIQLNRGIPLGIHYNVNRILKNGSQLVAKHASSIVGRRKRGGRCEYLIRNSWGPGCGGYKYPCEAGNVWVPESELDMVISTVWLQK
jgi:hypothetical protein